MVLVLAGTTGCATSSGPPASVDSMNLAGVWSFDVVLEESIRGSVTLTGDDRYVAQCFEDFSRPDPPSLLQRRAGLLEFRACGATFRVRREEDGRVTADVTRQISRPYTAQGPCVETRTYDDGTVRCVRYENEIRYRQETVRQRIELTPMIEMGVSRPASSR
jgi:hypothetical protein